MNLETFEAKSEEEMKAWFNQVISQLVDFDVVTHKLHNNHSAIECFNEMIADYDEETIDANVREGFRRAIAKRDPKEIKGCIDILNLTLNVTVVDISRQLIEVFYKLQILNALEACVEKKH